MTAPKNVRVGLVGLETSHPAAFTPILRELGFEVTAVHDLAGTRAEKSSEDRAERFASEYGIPVVAQDEAELAEVCDVVILLGCDWDARFSAAMRLLDRGLGVVMDKPLAGRVGDLRRLRRMVSQGVPIAGGSSLRFAPEIVARRQAGPEPSLVVAGCAGHPFYYGVHAASSAAAVLGAGFEAVRGEPTAAGLRGMIRHAGGAQVVIDIQPERSSGPAFPFHVTVTSGAGVEHLLPDVSRLYRSYLDATLSQVVAPAQPMSGSAEPELALLAIRWSLDHGGDWVSIEALPDDFAPWSGAEFLKAYLAG